MRVSAVIGITKVIASSTSQVDLVELLERVIARNDAADVDELGAGGHHLRQKLLKDALL